MRSKKKSRIINGGLIYTIALMIIGIAITEIFLEHLQLFNAGYQENILSAR